MSVILIHYLASDSVRNHDCGGNCPTEASATQFPDNKCQKNPLNSSLKCTTFGQGNDRFWSWNTQISGGALLSPVLQSIICVASAYWTLVSGLKRL